jgi:glycosyltransferase involved in cell wall biosynthesis
MLAEIFPQADWYTSYVDNSLDWHKKLNIHSSFIQRLPSFVNKNRMKSLPFYPFAFESFDFSSYDLVFSVSSSFAKSVITKPKTKHIAYILSPTRMLWGDNADLYGSSVSRVIFKPYLSYLKKWDFIAAQRADVVLTLSSSIKNKIQTHYKRSAEVAYPPFNYGYWKNFKSHQDVSEHIQKVDPYYLVVSRLEPYKKIDCVIEAFNSRKEKLIIVGKGSLLGTLKKRAGKNIQFLEKTSDSELAVLYSHAEALIMPQEEDFGYTALEAQFFGCPVIAFNKGGALETVKNMETGIFFNTQTAQDVNSAIENFSKVSYTLQQLTAQNGEDEAKKFSIEHFHNQIKKYL